MAKQTVSAEEAKLTTATMAFRFMIPREDDPVVQESAELLETATKVKIKNDKGEVVVNNRLVRVKEMLSRAKADKELVMRPIKDQLIAPIEAFFKLVIPPLEKAEKMYKVAIGDYMMKKDTDMKELAEALKDVDGAVALAPETRIENDSGRTSATPVWNFELEDGYSTKVPVEYLRRAVETKRGREGLEQIIRATIEGGIRKIPGVTVTEGRQISVTLKM